MNIIKLQIDDEKELFSTLNPDEESFTDGIKSYILRNLSKADIDHKITIRFFSSRPVSEDRIKKAVDTWIKEEKADLHEKNRDNMRHQFWMFGIGVVFLSLAIFLQPKVNLIWFTILSTIGSLSLWEAANIWIIENPKMLKIKKTIEKLEKNVIISVVSGKDSNNGSL